MEDQSEKVCIACEKPFPRTKQFFYANKAYLTKGDCDGLLPRCKKCHHERRVPRRKVEEGKKWCPGCEQELPANHDHFGVCESRTDHLNVYCIPCSRRINTDKYAKAKEAPKKTAPPTFLCPGCGLEKPATKVFFPEQVTCKYGLRTTCSKCEWEQRKPSALAYRPRRRELERKRYPKRRTYFEQRYQSRREEILGKQHRFKQNYPDVVQGWKKKYSSSERGHLHQRINVQNRRARMKALPGELTDCQIQEKLKQQRYRCYYAACGYARFKKKKGKYMYHIEHTVPVSRTECGPRHDINFVVLSCGPCNDKKHNKLPHEWPEGGRLL